MGHRKQILLIGSPGAFKEPRAPRYLYYLKKAPRRWLGLCRVMPGGRVGVGSPRRPASHRRSVPGVGYAVLGASLFWSPGWQVLRPALPDAQFPTVARPISSAPSTVPLTTAGLTDLPRLGLQALGQRQAFVPSSTLALREL